MSRNSQQSASEASNPSERASEPLEGLVIRLRAGQEDALELLIARTEKACYALAHSILRNPDLSRDALQEAYLQVFQRIGHLREPKAFRSWMFRIVTNCCHDIQRKRASETETDPQVQEDLAEPPMWAEPEQDLASKVSRLQELRAVFQRLPEIDRTVIGLREICSLSYEEMSEVLKIPLGTVRSRLAKARKRFIATYNEEKSS